MIRWIYTRISWVVVPGGAAELDRLRAELKQAAADAAMSRAKLRADVELRIERLERLAEKHRRAD